MAKKPPNLIYGVDDNPPFGTSMLLGLQHVFTPSIVLIFPVVMLEQTGGDLGQAQRLIDMSMVAMGVATILQSLRKGPLGSGYLCPQIIGPAYLSASILAVKAGGLPMLAGMTVLSGLCGTVLSRLMRHLRPLFPAEVTGTVVAIVGLELVPLTVSKFLGVEASGSRIEPLTVSIASITLLTMMSLSVWGRQKLRLYCALIGVGVGYALAYGTGFLGEDQLRRLAEAPLIAMPAVIHGGWSFSPSLLIPFFVAAVASSLKTVGDLTTCQKINDAEWSRPDMNSISGGILADACGVVLSGGLGTMGQSTSSANVGLSIATGATSRAIAFAIGGILILAAFVPKLAAFFVIMPGPVMGALLLFVVSFMVVAGIQIITSRMMDARKTFVVGISLILGLSVDMLPGIYQDLPAMLRPVFSSSLSVATFTAILMNLFFRIGIAKRAQLELEPGGNSSEQIYNFMETQGGNWGARREVVYSATAALNELVESVTASGLALGKIQTAVTFDEFNLDIDVRYHGKPMEFPATRPTETDLLDDERGVAKLAGFLVRQYADRVRSEVAEGHCRVQLHFDH